MFKNFLNQEKKKKQLHKQRKENNTIIEQNTKEFKKAAQCGLTGPAEKRPSTKDTNTSFSKKKT